MKILKHIIGLASLAAALSAAGAANAAEILSSSVIYGGTGQKRAVCYFTNVGSTAITLNNYGVFDQNGSPVALVIDGCATVSATLGTLQTCGIAADIANNVTSACRTRTKDKTNLRGTIEIRDVNQNILNSQQLR